MLAPTETLEHLKGRLAEAIGLLPLEGPHGLASVILELPHVPALAPFLAAPQFQFAHCDHQTLHAGYGVAAEWQAEGPDRLATLRRRALALGPRWHQFDLDETGIAGFAMLGFAASPIRPARREGADGPPNALFWVPELGLRGRGDQGALVLTTALPARADDLLQRWHTWLERLIPNLLAPPIEPPRTPMALTRRGDLPDVSGWERLVEAALAQIAQGRLEKAVVSRRLQLAAERPFDLERLMAVLGELYPSCQLIHLRRDGTSFVAATPERLLTQAGEEVEVDAIAGTVARAADPERDAALAEALRASRKDRHEHQLVIAAVREALSQCADQIQVPPDPTVMQLRNAQHLWSPVRARLRPGVDIFRLAELLHPTPATNGEPRAAASAWLRQAEPLERGWYTGAAGIVAPDLSGELWVLLRCARLEETRAELYAGAGIVAGSDPLCEWQETEDKLAAMLTALRFA